MAPTKTPKVTREQAETVLKAIKEQFAPYVEEGYEPTLSMDWDGYVAILWEGGPYEWAYRAQEGGYDEEASILSGRTIETPAASAWPEDVWGEPYYSFVLTLHLKD